MRCVNKSMQWSHWLLACVAMLLAASMTIPSDDADVLAAISHAPTNPNAGQGVEVSVALQPDVVPAEVVLTHCRVEPTYACRAQGDYMLKGADGLWRATIPWDARFFEPETRWVGYNLLVDVGDGQLRMLPSESVPHAPDGLPPDGGHYFFYQIEAGQVSPLAWPIPVLAVVIALGVRRRVFFQS